MINSIKSIIRDSISLKQAILEDEEIMTNLLKVIYVITNCIKNGKKVMLAGNGGSAADSQHFAAELVGKISSDRVPLPAIALTTDTSIITAVSNDYDFTEIFARQIKAIGNPGDVIVLISTSGNSPNLLKAAQEAKNKGIISIGLLGRNGGKLKDMVDIAVVVKHDNTQRIQEAHIMIEHIICELIEQILTSS
ncbi:MAG: SIS domain-containing protein [bacterium]